MTNNNSIHEWIINNFLKNISKCTAYRAGCRLVSYNYLIQYFSLKQKKKKAMEWSQNHFEAYNSTCQTLFVYNITLTWHLDQGYLQFCVNFMYLYGIIWRGKKLTKFYLSFFPTKNTYIYSYRAHLSKIFFTWRFHNISNSHDTVTSCLLAMQNI